jgi:hypothetical protein
MMQWVDDDGLVIYKKTKMIVAREKRKKNIAEYILYMWHVEDLLRACNLEFTTVRDNLISRYKADAATISEISEWYQDLIHTMVREKITVSGHLQSISKIIEDLNRLHLHLLSASNNLNYRQFYETARPNIEIFKEKSMNQAANDIEICLNALYSFLLLRLAKKEITPGTMDSMKSFSELLSILSLYFKKLEEEKAPEK